LSSGDGQGRQDPLEGDAVLDLLATIALVVTVPLALLFLGWAHHWYWRGRLAPRCSPDEEHHLRTADGWRIGLRRYRPRGEGRRYAEPVILCHGLGANHLNLDWDPPNGLAQYLAEQGRDCWVICLRGNAGSDRPTFFNELRWGFSFDDYLEHDVPAAIEHVLAATGADQVQWVGHSMGGILAYALGGTEWERHLGGGVVTVASPVGFVNQPYLRWISKLGVVLAGGSRIRQRVVTQMLAPFSGFFEPPYADLIIASKSIDAAMIRRLQGWVIEDISAGVMGQFNDWVQNDAFRSLDRSQDYRERMGRYRVPAFLIAGSRDRMAPPEAVAAAFEWLGSPDKAMVTLGKEFGQETEYGHGDLLLGRDAPAEVYPRIAAWLDAHATEVA